jgi:DNA-binding NarL/FixJ family response regulator
MSPGGARRMTDREPTDPLPALYREMLEREARLERLLERLLECGWRSDTRGRLTKREVQVLRLLATGHTGRQIAAHLKIAPTTVRNHLNRTYPKLGVSTRTQAAVRAFDLGLGHSEASS